MVKFKARKPRLTTREKIIKQELDVCREQLIREKLSLECIISFEQRYRDNSEDGHACVPFEEKYPNLVSAKQTMSGEIGLLEFKLNFLKQKRSEQERRREENLKRDIESLKESEMFPDKVSIKDMEEIKENN